MKVAATSRTIQDEFPSLDFPGRTVLYVHEVAERLGYSEKHIFDLIDEGQLDAFNGTGRGNRTDRRSLRIPKEAYLRFVSGRMLSRQQLAAN